MISKTHRVAQKPHGRQLNAKVWGSESAIYAFFHYHYKHLHYTYMNALYNEGIAQSNVKVA